MNPDQTNTEIIAIADDRMSRTEWALLLSAISISAVVGYLILSDFSMISNSYAAKSAPIARIESAENTVKRRPAGVPIWNVVERDQKLYQRDQVFTDNNSSVVVRFNNNDSIVLEENALVIIERFNNSATINIKRGVVTAAITGQSRNLKLKVGNTQTVLSGQGAKVVINANKSNGQSSIAVLSGKADVSQGDKKISLEADQAVKVKKETIEKSKVLQVGSMFPRPDSTLLKESHRVNFGWRKINRKNLMIEIAEDSNFSNIIVVKKVSAAKTQADLLRDGKFFWRLGAYNPKTRKTDYTIARKFILKKLVAPRLKWPAMNQEIKVAEDTPEKSIMTYLDWEQIDEMSVGYQVQLSKSSNFRKTKYNAIVKSAPLQMTELSGGDYYWRVRGIADKKSKTPWSQIGMFRVVEDKRQLTEDQLKVSLVDTGIRTVKIGNKIKFVWQSYAGASAYKTEVSKSHNFEKVIDRQSLASETIFSSWLAKSIGKYYWRIKPEVAGGLFSTPVAFDVIPATAVALFPQEGQKIKLKTRSSTVKFSWNKTIGAKSYTLEVANDTQFREVVFSKQTKENQFNWQSVPDGAFAWRVRANYPKYAAAYDKPFSPAINFTVKLVVVERPVALAPNLTSLHFIRKRTSPVKFSWEDRRYYKKHEIHLSKNIEFDRPRVTYSDTGSLLLNLTSGRYFWKLRSISGQRISKWSAVRVFRVRVPLARSKFLVDENIFILGEKGKIKLSWRKVKGAAQYKYELAADSEFKQIIYKNTASNTTSEQLVGVGRYYSRVAGISSEGIYGQWSKPLRLAIKTAPLLQATSLVRPKNKFKSYYRVIVPTLSFKWKPVSGAIKYEMQLSKDETFKKVKYRNEFKGTQWKKDVTRGKYYWRVRPIDQFFRAGPWTASRTLDIEKGMERPSLLVPGDDAIIDFDEDETHRMQFLWSDTDKLRQVKIVVAKDKKFKEIVGQIFVEGSSANLNVYEDGEYYWFVQGRDQDERVALRSDVNHFTMKTTPVELPNTYTETFKVEAAYTPTRLEYNLNEDGGDDVNFKVNFAKSYMMAVKGWMSRQVGIDIEYRHRVREFKYENKENSIKKQKIKLELIDIGGALKYRFKLFRTSFPIDVAARFGYYFNQMPTFFTTADEEGEEFYGLQSNNVHNVLGGFETSVPMGGSSALEVKLDYLHILTSDPVIVKRNYQYIAGLNILHQYFKYTILGYGIFYRKQFVRYRDEEYSASGDLDTLYYGLLVSLGWVL